MRCLSACLSIAGALLCHEAAAEDGAGEHGRSAIVAVAESGGDEDAGTAIRPEIVASLEEQGWSVELADDADTRAIEGCAWGERAACVPELMKDASASNVLFVHAQPPSGGDDAHRVLLRGRLIERRTGKVVGTSQRHCLRCRQPDKLAELAGELAFDIVRTRESRLYPHTGIKVVSVPADAIVALGGVDLGPSGQVYRVSPGPHEVTVRREGFEASTRSVRLRPNQELVLEVELAPAGKRASRGEADGADTSMGALPWTLLGAGAAGVTLGTTLIVLHEDAVRGGERQTRARNSRGWGIAALSAGVASGAAAGFVLWRRNSTRGAADVALMPYESGGMVVWSGAF